MVASKQLKIAFFSGISRERGRETGALPQVIGRTRIPLLRKNVIPAAKRMGADLLEIAAPNIEGVVSGGKKFKTAGECGRVNSEKTAR